MSHFASDNGFNGAVAVVKERTAMINIKWLVVFNQTPVDNKLIDYSVVFTQRYSKEWPLRTKRFGAVDSILTGNSLLSRLVQRSPAGRGLPGPCGLCLGT